MFRSAVLVLLLTLAGCASERVVLLPNPDGHVSHLRVQQGEQQTELHAPYESVAAGSGRPKVATLDAATVQRAFGSVLAAMPAAASSYVLYFETDSIDAIAPESKGVLEAALKDIGSRVAPEITVIGHTDRVGEREYNDKLSLDRAVVVAAQIRTRLTSLGLDDSNVDVAGRGEREPVLATNDEVAEARNRRVEVSVR